MFGLFQVLSFPQKYQTQISRKEGEISQPFLCKALCLGSSAGSTANTAGRCPLESQSHISLHSFTSTKSATTYSLSRDPPHVFLSHHFQLLLLPYIRPLSRISPLSVAVLPKYAEPRADVKGGFIPLCQLYLMHRSHPALNTEPCFSVQKH